jgi:hypothetical protein
MTLEEFRALFPVLTAQLLWEESDSEIRSYFGSGEAMLIHLLSPIPEADRQSEGEFATAQGVALLAVLEVWPERLDETMTALASVVRAHAVRLIQMHHSFCFSCRWRDRPLTNMVVPGPARPQ